MNIAIVLSGGIGSRMKTNGIPKQYIVVAGKPVLIHTLNRFQECDSVDRIIIVVSPEWIEIVKEWVAKYSISKVVDYASPGETRQGSIYNGLIKCNSIVSSGEDIVIIHDAARPLVSNSLISSCIEQAKIHGACMPVLPLNDTVYISNDGKKVDALLDRNVLFAGQAPEAFLFEKYYSLNSGMPKEQLDLLHGTSEIAFMNGMDVYLIDGEFSNFKLTTPDDLERFTQICEEGNNNR